MLLNEEIKSGIFVDYYTKFYKTLSEKELNEFSNLKDGINRIKWISEILKKDQFPFELLTTNNKEYEAAFKLKCHGNEVFIKEDFKSALKCYSDSILLMPWDNTDCGDLCILLANRSACLYNLQNYDSALSDINYCIELGGYPNELKYKIYDREARCNLAKDFRLNARNSFRKTLQALDDAKLVLEKKQKFQKDVQIMISMLEHGNLKNFNKTEKITNKETLTGGNNKKFPNVCSAVQFEYAGPEEGRIAMAKSQIKAGDVILVEKPHVIALLQEHSKTHCWHCLSFMVTPYPCQTCSDVAFCSTKCVKLASKYHKYECNFLPTLWKTGASITCLLAFRAIIQVNASKFKTMKLESTMDLSKYESYDSSKYPIFYNLITHEKKRSPNDLLHRSFMAYFLLNALKETKYITNENLEDQYLIGSLLLHNLQVCQFNSHEVSELVEKKLSCIDTGYMPDEKFESKSIFIGGAVYPTLALFNHSCNPGIVRYFKQDGTIIARAIRGFQVGDEINENYGPIYTNEVKEVRQERLKDVYLFECHCTPCQENWPTFDSIPEFQTENMRLRCDECGSSMKIDTEQLAIQCKICKSNTSVLASLAALAGTEKKLKAADAKKDTGENCLNDYLEIIKIFDKYLSPPPTKDYVLCQQQIRKCMLKYGKYRSITK